MGIKLNVFSVFILFTIFINAKDADEINFRKILLTNNVNNDDVKESNTSYGIFIGLGGGLTRTIIKHTIKQDDNQTSAKNINERSFINGFIGAYSDRSYFGGRMYVSGSYFTTPFFKIIDGGLNIDLLINFVDSNTWNIGTILGLGGGMYLASLQDKSLAKEAISALSPIGWVNTGFRVKFKGSSLEIIYKIPFTDALVYNNAIYTNTQNTLQTKYDIYYLRASLLSINYVHYF